MLPLTDPALLASLQEIAGPYRIAAYAQVAQELQELDDTGERWLVVQAASRSTLVALYAQGQDAADAGNEHSHAYGSLPEHYLRPFDVIIDREDSVLHAPLPDFELLGDGIEHERIDIEAARKRIVEIDYTNYRGERSRRRILPGRIHYGVSAYHDGPQWFVDAIDVERSVNRTFALADVHEWIHA